MPKTLKNVWDRFVEWDNLVEAAKKASQGRRFHRDVLEFNFSRTENLIRIQKELVSGTWRPGPYRQLWVYEPKKRLVHAPQFADRVVHHALVQVVGAHFERRFISDSYACRVGRGTHAASKRLSGLLRSAHEIWGRFYVLKADISKYFYSIDHNILMDILARIVGDRKILDVFRLLVEESPLKEYGVGLPLGALTSQLCANAYLDVFDHYVKDKLGIRHYVRYMDDFIVLHHSKPVLWSLLDSMRDFLSERLKLTLNCKTSIFPSSRGVDFAGYRHWNTHALPRKRNVKRAKKRFAGLSRVYARGEISLDRVRSCVTSFTGYIMRCKGRRSAESALSKLILVNSSKEI